MLDELVEEYYKKRRLLEVLEKVNFHPKTSQYRDRYLRYKELNSQVKVLKEKIEEVFYEEES